MNQGEPSGSGAPEAPRFEDEKTSEDISVQEKEIPVEDGGEIAEKKPTPEIVIEEPQQENQVISEPTVQKYPDIEEKDVLEEPIYTTSQAAELQDTINSLQE